MAKLTWVAVTQLASDLMFWEDDLQSVSKLEFESKLVEWQKVYIKLIEKGIESNKLLGTNTFTDGDMFSDIKTHILIGCT